MKNNSCIHVRLDSRANQWMRVDLRENESVSVDPVGVLGVETHELVEKNVRDGGHAHGGTGVTRVGFGGRIDLWEHTMSVQSIIDYPPGRRIEVYVATQQAVTTPRSLMEG